MLWKRGPFGARGDALETVTFWGQRRCSGNGDLMEPEEMLWKRGAEGVSEGDSDGLEGGRIG